MNPAQKLLADMNKLPIGGALIVLQPEANTTDDVVVYRKTGHGNWERLRYPYTLDEAEAVTEATVGWEALLVGSVQALLPKKGARSEVFDFLRRSVEKAFATVDANTVQA